jgi:hypothetical protein
VKTDIDFSCEVFSEKLASVSEVLKKIRSSDKYYAIARVSSSK